MTYAVPNAILGPFYANYSCNKNEKGDLALHTNYSIYKNCKWVTDEIGYRKQ